MDKQIYRNQAVALIMSAGSGTRVNLGYNKLLHRVNNRTVLEYTLDKFSCPRIVVCSSEDYKTVSDIVKAYPKTTVTTGGDTRHESVFKGLEFIGDCDYCIIHDGARPNVKPALIAQVLDSAIKTGSGVAYIPCPDSVRDIRKGPLDRQDVILVQTPQAYNYKQLLSAYRSVKECFTDDSQVYEAAGKEVSYVLGDADNYKITTRADLDRFESHMRTKYENRYRIGTGYDVHRLTEGRKLILGGVVIPHLKGLEGHSDADVLIHAIMDALLSAAGERDIGVQFPENDVNKNVSSIELLKRVGFIVMNKEFRIGNISAVIHAERPKLNQYIPRMQRSIAEALGINAENVAISATTWEGMSFVGKKEGMAASATCLLY